VGYSPKYPVGNSSCLLQQSSGLSFEDAKDMDDWRLRLRQMDNVGLPGKWPLKWRMCVYAPTFELLQA